MIAGATPIVADWDFVASPLSPRLRVQRALRWALRTRLSPACAVLTPLTPNDAWATYFVHAPDGELTASHRFTLGRLRDSDMRVLVVCAARQPAEVPDELGSFTDALIWKQLSGYDFSAYSIALRAVARTSPGAQVLFLNDSVLGPLHDLAPLLHRARWDLTGFTASAVHENHLQSYAFSLRGVDGPRASQLRRAFPRHVAFDDLSAVVVCQETRLARLAAQHMTVGSLWYAPPELDDPTLTVPVQLLDAGFPFIKRSLFGKHQRFQGSIGEVLLERLRAAGHPLEGLDGAPPSR